MKNIKHLFFDLGNVLLDIDYDRARRQFRELLGEDWDFDRGITQNKDLFASFQDGRLSEDEFFEKLKKQAPKPVERSALEHAWNSMLVQLPWERFVMLRRLKNNYMLYLISNTNATHLRHLNRLLREEHGLGLKDFQSIFTRVYYSHKMKMGKPDPKVYQHLLEDSGVRPAEALFIDDLEENVRAAETAGMKGYHHNPEEEIAEVLPKLLTNKAG